MPIAQVDRPPRDETSMKLSEKVAKCIIEARCTDNVLFSGTAALGSLALLLQTVPVCMNSWVLLTEPRPLNTTSDNGEQLETTFSYNIGYFQICRQFIFNISGTETFEPVIPESEARYTCYLNPLLSHADLTEFSVASLAIVVRLGLPTLVHITGALICCLAFLLGVVGHLRRTVYTLFSVISYICGSIALCIAVFMVVCVVDDELEPRMRPNAAGEPTRFKYSYGYPFFSAALAFLPVQGCACLQAFLYFRRFPTVVQKLKYVPGLEAKLRHAQLDKELGIPPTETWRRGSLASYLPQPSLCLASRRSSRKASEVSNPNLLFVQDIV